MSSYITSNVATDLFGEIAPRFDDNDSDNGVERHEGEADHQQEEADADGEENEGINELAEYNQAVQTQRELLQLPHIPNAIQLQNEYEDRTDMSAEGFLLLRHMYPHAYSPRRVVALSDAFTANLYSAFDQAGAERPDDDLLLNAQTTYLRLSLQWRTARFYHDVVQQVIARTPPVPPVQDAEGEDAFGGNEEKGLLPLDDEEAPPSPDVTAPNLQVQEPEATEGEVHLEDEAGLSDQSLPDADKNIIPGADKVEGQEEEEEVVVDYDPGNEIKHCTQGNHDPILLLFEPYVDENVKIGPRKTCYDCRDISRRKNGLPGGLRYGSEDGKRFLISDAGRNFHPRRQYGIPGTPPRAWVHPDPHVIYPKSDGKRPLPSGAKADDADDLQLAPAPPVEGPRQRKSVSRYQMVQDYELDEDKEDASDKESENAARAKPHHRDIDDGDDSAEDETYKAVENVEDGAESEDDNDEDDNFASQPTKKHSRKQVKKGNAQKGKSSEGGKVKGGAKRARESASSDTDSTLKRPRNET